MKEIRMEWSESVAGGSWCQLEMGRGWRWQQEEEKMG